MVRTGVPGGRLTSQQLLAHIELADKYGNGTLRITSRQDLQMHGLAKQDLRAVLKRIHEVGLTTMATCGDVHRNVVCCPAPYRGDPVHGQIQWMAGQIAEALSPRTPAYREIWLDDSSAACSLEPEQEIEPLYGKSYLPRKFKVGIGLPGDNCADVYCQDVGLLAVCRNYDVIGYNVLVGGGMGMTPAKPSTFPALAQRMAYARADQILDLLRAILGVFRDFGNRSDRKRARLKYLVADWGLERFKKQVEQYLGYELPPPEPDEVWDIDDHLGWREQGDGRWFYGLHVPSGRIQDTGEVRLKSALREICEGHGPAIYLTPGQSLLLGDVYWDDRLHIEDHLRRYGLRLVGEITHVRRWAGACVSLPTCPLALTESERALPDILQELEGEVARLGLAAGGFRPADDRLHERLFAALQRGYGHRRPCRRPLCHLSRRPPHRRPAQFPLSRRRAAGAACGHARARAGLLQAASPGRRNARRFLPSPGPRSANGGVARAVKRAVDV